MNEHSDNEQFTRLIVALEPWLTQVVIIGGWAHTLYRLHPNAQRIEYLPLTTLDTDIAIPARLKVIDKDLRERLIAHGFEEDRLGSDQPPATHYRLGDAKTGFYAEFLTPLFGPEHGRDGKPKATRRVAGVVSQQLRHLEILLLNPWTVSLSGSNGFPFVDPKEIRIPNPLSFLAHKVLIHKKRMRPKFAKDDRRTSWPSHSKNARNVCKPIGGIARRSAKKPQRTCGHFTSTSGVEHCRISSKRDVIGESGAGCSRQRNRSAGSAPLCGAMPKHRRCSDGLRCFYRAPNRTSRCKARSSA